MGRKLLYHLWICCRCGQGQWNNKTTPRCLNCGHAVDSYCPKTPVYELRPSSFAYHNSFPGTTNENSKSTSDSQRPNNDGRRKEPVENNPDKSTRMPPLSSKSIEVIDPATKEDQIYRRSEPSATIDKALKLEDSLSLRRSTQMDDVVDDDTSDTSSTISSVFSDVSSLGSATTTSCHGSQIATVRREAVDAFAQLLLQDGPISSFLAKGLEMFGINRLEKNFRRLLRQFAVDFLQEAKTEAEQQVGKLVKRSAHEIVHVTISTLGQFTAEGTGQRLLLEQWVQSLDLSEKNLPDEAGSEGSGNTSDEEADLPGVDQLRASISTSSAFSKLRAALKKFVYPGLKIQETHIATEHERGNGRRSTLIQYQTIRTTLVGFLRNIARPRIPADHQRITWICGCGKAMYADVQELEEGAAARLEQELRMDTAAAAAKSSTGTPFANEASQSPSEMTTFQGRSSRTFPSNSTSTSETVGNSESHATASQRANTSAIDPEPEGSARKVFLLLCVNGPSHRRWKSLDITAELEDGKLFQAIRKEYDRLRQSYPRGYDQIACSRVWQRLLPKVVLCGDRLWDLVQMFFTPKSASFVQFQVIPVKNATAADITSQPCLPPKLEVDSHRYHYRPCPANVANPCLRIPFLHSLLSSGGTNAHTDHFWTNRIPKKLGETLRYNSGLDDVIGWGVYIVEGPNYFTLAVLTAISLILSIVLALAYSLKTHDVSSGFTVASFFLAVEAVVLTLATTVLVTALSYPN